MTLKIEVTISKVYGIDKIYPACRLSEAFCELLKQKTLAERDIQCIKKLGYAIEEVTPKRKF